MAGVTDKAEGVIDKARPPKGAELPGSVTAKLKRGREGLKQVAARRREAVHFAHNEHYVGIDKSGLKITSQSVVSRNQGGEKPNHRVRRSHDVLAPILKGKISASTQRVPGYEVMAASDDPEDYSAARIAEKVLIAGYDIWDLKEAFRLAVWQALVTEESFLMPYWDSSVGPFIDVEPDGGGEPYRIGMGEVKIRVYSGLEVLWEPGVPFNDSRWYAVDHARPREQVENEEGFIGAKLENDAESSIVGQRSQVKGEDLVMVTEYFERPCKDYQRGRHLISANGRKIFPEEDYPLRDQDDEVVDGPCLRRLYYSIDGDSERARGLVGSLVETVRNFDYFSNKAAEYVQLVLTPQLIAPEGAIKSTLTDEPGIAVEVDEEALAAGYIKWREMPSMPNEFESERDRAQGQLGYIANDNLVPNQVESGKAIGALAQKDILAWQDFIEDLADVHSGVGRDALCIVQRMYSEQRMVKFRGSTGWESIADFRGADIRGQTDVRVSPGSLEPLTRAVVETRIMNVAQMFPGYFPPEVLIAALSSGNFDRLNESYEQDEARVNFIIAQIKGGKFFKLPPRSVFPGEEGPKMDYAGAIEWEEEPQWEVEPERDAEGKPIPATGQPVPGTGRPVMNKTVPGWMPRPFDGIPIHKRRMETFMKTDEWPNLPMEAQQASLVYYDTLLQLEARKAARDAALQNQTAERLGKENAAKPTQLKALPSLPSPEAPNGNGAEAPEAPAE